MTCLHACFLKSLLGRLNGPKHEAPWPKLTPFFPRTGPQVTYPLVSGVRLCWELKEPEGLKGLDHYQCFFCSPFYGRACRWAMVGELKPKGPNP